MKNFVHVYIYGLIGSFINDQGEKEVGIELEDVIAAINAKPDAEGIVVHINSQGGNVQAGFDIYNHLVGLGKTVHTQIEENCKSIATIIALAGSTRTITPGSDFTIHNPWGIIAGDSDEVKEAADQLKLAENKIINFYHEKTGIPKESLDALMKKETEMNPDKALSLKFVTEIVNEVVPVAYIPKGKLKIDPASGNSQMEQMLATMMEFMKNPLRNIQNGQHADVTLTLADGRQIVVVTESGTPAVGDVVTLDGQPAPDGDYVMSDGSSISVADGKITAITPKTDDAASAAAAAATAAAAKVTDPATQAAIAGVVAQNAGLKTSIDTISAGQNLQNQMNVAMLAQLQTFGKMISSDYVPEGGSGPVHVPKVVDPENRVTAGHERKKDYKGAKKPE